MTTVRTMEFSEDRAAAISALDEVGEGRGWCNVTPQIAADDVEVLSVNVFSLRVKKGAPIATFVTSPDKKGESRPSTLGVLHNRGRLGKARIAELTGGAVYLVKQDHTQRGLLLEIPATALATDVLVAMCTLLEGLCDYERTAMWRMDVYTR